MVLALGRQTVRWPAADFPACRDLRLAGPLERRELLAGVEEDGNDEPLEGSGVKRTQVPILPAYSMTAHKAQGQTFSNVIVDLESCKGSEAPYVMLSRATSLNGVLILRRFNKKKIRSNPTEFLRRELGILLTFIVLMYLVLFLGGHINRIDLCPHQ